MDDGPRFPTGTILADKNGYEVRVAGVQRRDNEDRFEWCYRLKGKMSEFWAWELNILVSYKVVRHKRRGMDL